MASANTVSDGKTKAKRSIFKYCIVPKCTNTTVKTPNKLFISLPQDPVRRKLWQKAMRRDMYLRDKTNKYVCEDHFNLEEDMTNYRYYKTMGKGNVYVKIKAGVVPHIFYCQKDDKAERLSPSRGAFEKRKQHDISEALSAQKKPKTEKNIDNPESHTHEEIIEPAKLVTSTNKDKGVQINIKSKKKSKSTQCNFN